MSLLASGGVGGVDRIEYRLDGDEWLTYTDSFTLEDEGETALEYFAVDVAGNIEPVQTQMIHIDTMAPVTTSEVTGESGENGWFVGPVEVALAADDDTSRVGRTEYRLDEDVEWLTYADPFTLEDEGATTLHYRSVDAAGNEEPANDLTVQIDTVAPVTTKTLTGDEGGSGWFRGPVEVALAAEDDTSGVERTEYRLDDEAEWLTYADPFTVEDEGATPLHYRSVDVAGNIETAQTRVIHIDTVAPVTTSTVDGELGDNDWFVSPVEVTLIPDDGTSGVERVEYRLEDDAWQTYEDTFVLDAEGFTTLHYRAVDVAGNEEPANELTVQIDTVAPVTTSTVDGESGENDWFVSPVEVTLEGDDGTSGVERTEYRLDDDVEWLTYADPFTVEDEGATTLHYRSVDVAGNIETAQTRVIHIDTVAPMTTSTVDGELGDNDWFVSPVEVTLEATATESEIDRIEYRLGPDEPWQTYEDTFVLDAEGFTTLHYRAVDVAGNEEPANELTVQIDTVPPVTTSEVDGESGENGWFVSPVEVTLIPDDGTSGVERVEYRLDDDAWQSYEGAFVLDAEGLTTLHYRAVDVAGNEEPANDLTVQIDSVPPVTTKTLMGDEGGSGWFRGPVEVALATEDDTSGVERIEYRLDEDVEWLTYADPFTVEDEGATTLHYRSVDVAGNLETAQAHVIIIDSVAPTTTSAVDGESGENGWFVSPVEVTLEATATESEIDRIEYRLGPDEPWQTYEDTFVLDAEGFTTLHYRSVDVAGNEEPANELTVQIDAVVPVTTSEVDGQLGENDWFVSPVEVTLIPDDDTSGVERIEYRLNGGEWQVYEDGFTIDAVGVTVIEYFAVDAAGHVEQANQKTVQIDTEAPTVALAAELEVKEPETVPAELTVEYVDNLSLDVTSIVGNDEVILVTGPNEFESFAVFVDIDDASENTARKVTYHLDAPSGGWTSEHNGTYTIHVRENQVADIAGNAIMEQVIGTFAIEIDPPAHVSGRYVFYNNSSFDGFDASPGAHNDVAIAPDKQPLLPGASANFANYTNYVHGLNGIFVDITGLAQSDDLGPDDLVFRVGASDEPADWASLADVPDVTVRSGDGVGGSDRVELIFDDHAVTNTWLEITVRANDVTGLAEDDVFYFGNLIGAVNDDVADTITVTSADVDAIRANQTGFGSAAIDNPYDIDRSGRVDLGDVIRARNAQGAATLETFALVADLTIDAGEHELVAGEQGQTIELFVNVANGTPLVAGLELNVSLGDGGEALDGEDTAPPAPAITNIDLITGTIFDDAGQPFTAVQADPETHPLVRQSTVDISDPATATVPADGLIAVITFDATDAIAGDEFPLHLHGGEEFPTQFFNAAGQPVQPALTSGTIRIVAHAESQASPSVESMHAANPTATAHSQAPDVAAGAMQPPGDGITERAAATRNDWSAPPWRDETSSAFDALVAAQRPATNPSQGIRPGHGGPIWAPSEPFGSVPFGAADRPLFGARFAVGEADEGDADTRLPWLINTGSSAVRIL